MSEPLDLDALARAHDLLTLHCGEGADDPERYDAATAFLVTSTGVLLEIARAAKAYQAACEHEAARPFKRGTVGEATVQGERKRAYAALDALLRGVTGGERD